MELLPDCSELLVYFRTVTFTHVYLVRNVRDYRIPSYDTQVGAGGDCHANRTL